MYREEVGRDVKENFGKVPVRAENNSATLNHARTSLRLYHDFTEFKTN